jgi:hypothetical protein
MPLEEITEIVKEATILATTSYRHLATGHKKFLESGCPPDEMLEALFEEEKTQSVIFGKTLDDAIEKGTLCSADKQKILAAHEAALEAAHHPLSGLTYCRQASENQRRKSLSPGLEEENFLIRPDRSSPAPLEDTSSLLITANPGNRSAFEIAFKRTLTRSLSLSPDLGCDKPSDDNEFSFSDVFTPQTDPQKSEITTKAASPRNPHQLFVQQNAAETIEPNAPDCFSGCFLS